MSLRQSLRPHRKPHWTEMSELPADDKAVGRPRPKQGVVHVRHYLKGKPRLIFKRYRSTLVVLQRGKVAIYRFKKNADADDQLIQTIDLGTARIFLCEPQRRIKLTEGKDEYQLKLNRGHYSPWLESVTTHRRYRQAEMAHHLIKSSIADAMTGTDGHESIDRDVATHTYRVLSDKVASAQEQMQALNVKIKNIDENKEVIDQLAKAMGNNRIKSELLFYKTFIADAKAVNENMGQLLHLLARTVTSMKYKVSKMTPNESESALVSQTCGLSDDSLSDADADGSGSDSEPESGSLDSVTVTDFDASLRALPPTPKAPKPQSKATVASAKSPIRTVVAAKATVTASASAIVTTSTPQIELPPKSSKSAQEKGKRVKTKSASLREPLQKTAVALPSPIKPFFVRRNRLPSFAAPGTAPSGLALLKDAGNLPMNLYSPVTMLQVLCEELTYSQLLDKACKAPTAAERMVWVTAFAVSAYSGTQYRSRKPFNPLLAETYEFDRREDCGWRFFAEQVSHSPDISAAFSEGDGWQLESVSNVPRVTLSFTLIRKNILEMKPPPPTGVRLQLLAHDETYTWNKQTTHILNVTSADRKVAHTGTLKIDCTNKYTANVDFADTQKSTITGHIRDAKGKKTGHKFSGDWQTSVYVHDTDGATPRQLHMAKPVPQHFQDQFYGFGEFTMHLNELTANLIDSGTEIAPTDSRHRPDVRLLEHGKLDEARSEKLALETKQRKASVTKPIWFEAAADHPLGWELNKSYWDSKALSFKNVKFPELWAKTK